MTPYFSFFAFFAGIVAMPNAKTHASNAGTISDSQPTLCGHGPLQGLASGKAPSTPTNAIGRVAP